MYGVFRNMEDVVSSREGGDSYLPSPVFGLYVYIGSSICVRFIYIGFSIAF